MAQLSNRLQRLAPSATLAMSQKSAEMKAQGIDVINMRTRLQYTRCHQGSCQESRRRQLLQIFTSSGICRSQKGYRSQIKE